MSQPHTSVLLHETIQLFEGRQIRYFVDCTLGAGGHSEAILEHHPEIETLIGIDQDPASLKLAEKRLAPWKSKLALFHGNFSQLSDILDHFKIQEVNGILMDLGVSSMQLDQPEKGFSFMREGPLDMRMNPENPLSARDIVNEWDEKELGVIFRDFGEEKQWKSAARAIVKARSGKPIETTKELSDILYPVLIRRAKKGIHPLTLIFQALRIAVNQELEVLEEILPRAIERLLPGGVIAVISFHSLEDRLVKNFFRYEASDKEDTRGLSGSGLFLSKQPTIKLITKKPLEATEEETRLNPRSRSAKLRAAEKL
jgi:16S rRNA (cytosine1402-N4)-methyltransferase